MTVLNESPARRRLFPGGELHSGTTLNAPLDCVSYGPNGGWPVQKSFPVELFDKGVIQLGCAANPNNGDVCHGHQF